MTFSLIKIRECPVTKAAEELAKAARALTQTAHETEKELQVNGHKIREAGR